MAGCPLRLSLPRLGIDCRFGGLWIAAAVMALLMTNVNPALSQNPTGAIIGTVTDPSNAVIAGANVTATNADTGLSRVVTTSNLGTFRFENLQPGEYQVKAEAQGFATQTQKLVVRVANITTSNFAMSIGQSSEIVEVTGAAAIVSTTQSTISTVFNRVQVDTLPLNGRSFLSVGMLDPGSIVQYNAGESTMLPVFNSATRVSIASPFTGEVANVQANIQVDGIRVNDRYTGNTSQNFSAESVQEFQLNTLTFDLSSGTSASGVVNTVSRSGTSEYHGSAFFFFRDHNMAAYPAFKRSAFNPDPYFARKQYGFYLSGPVGTDRLLFFANYERNNQVGARTIQFTDPLAYSFNHIGKLPSNANVGGIRLDYKLAPTHNMFFRFNVDQNRAVVGGATLESTWLATDNFAYQTVLGVTSVLRPTLVNDFRFGFSYFREFMAAPTMEECTSVSGRADFCVGLGGPRINFMGGLSIGMDFSLPQDRHQRTNQFTDNVSWTKGTHTIRFGGNWEHMWAHGSVNVYRMGAFSTYSPTALQQLNQALYNALPASLRSVPGTTPTITEMLQLPMSGAFQIGLGDPSWPNSYKQKELLPNDLIRFYIQDGWQVRPKFTFNYGLAWSMETQIPYHKLDWPAYVTPLGLNREIIPMEYNHWEPAVGLAWSPGKGNKTVFRASASLHWASQNRTVDRMSDQNYRSPAGSSGVMSLTTASLANPKAGQPGQPATLNFSSPAAFTGQDMVNYIPTATALLSQIVSKYDGTDLSVRNIELLKQTSAGATNWIFDGNYHTPYSVQFNVGFSREIARNLGLSADYIMIRSVHFGANDVFTIDINRWNHITGYSIDPNTGAVPAASLVRTPVLPVCTPAQSQDPKALCSSGPITYAFAMQAGRYNSLQIRLERRFSRGLQFTGTYARSKTTAYNGIARFDNYKDSYGITANPKHKMTANATWTVPEYKGSRKLLRGLFNTWQLSAIMQMQTGLPINVTLGTYDPVGDGINNFRLPGMDVTTFGWSVSKDDIRRLVDAYNAKYPAPANVALKDVPRANRDAQGRAFPYVVLPQDFANNDSFMTHDLRLSRTFNIREKVRLHVNAEGFNIFNIANLTTFSGTLDAYVRPAATGGTPALPAQGLLFGQPQNRVSAIFGTGGPRAFQVSARLSF
jgi:hypothetical protein